MIDLTAVFAVQVCGYSVMSNHLHVVVFTIPRLAETWSAREVARRGLLLFPSKKPPLLEFDEAVDVKVSRRFVC